MKCFWTAIVWAVGCVPGFVFAAVNDRCPQEIAEDLLLTKAQKDWIVPYKPKYYDFSHELSEDDRKKWETTEQSVRAHHGNLRNAGKLINEQPAALKLTSKIPILERMKMNNAYEIKSRKGKFYVYQSQKPFVWIREDERSNGDVLKGHYEEEGVTFFNDFKAKTFVYNTGSGPVQKVNSPTIPVSFDENTCKLTSSWSRYCQDFVEADYSLEYFREAGDQAGFEEAIKKSSKRCQENSGMFIFSGNNGGPILIDLRKDGTAGSSVVGKGISSRPKWKSISDFEKFKARKNGRFSCACLNQKDLGPFQSCSSDVKQMIKNDLAASESLGFLKRTREELAVLSPRSELGRLCIIHVSELKGEKREKSRRDGPTDDIQSLIKTDI